MKGTARISTREDSEFSTWVTLGTKKISLGIAGIAIKMIVTKDKNVLSTIDKGVIPTI